MAVLYVKKGSAAGRPTRLSAHVTPACAAGQQPPWGKFAAETPRKAANCEKNET
jgi:hypothetical protein